MKGFLLIVFTLILAQAILIHSSLAQIQSHPLSEITPIDINLNMTNATSVVFNITNLGWLFYNGGITFAGTRGIPTTDIQDAAITSSKIASGVALTGNVSIDSPTFFVDSTNDRVGIGTANPSWALDITKPGITASIHLQKTDATTASWYLHSGRLGGGEFSIGDDSQYRMVINNQGNVGIGTTSPVKKLDVVGAINATGTIYSGGTAVLTSESDTLQTVTNRGAITSNQIRLNNTSNDSPGFGVETTGYGYSYMDQYNNQLRFILVNSTGQYVAFSLYQTSGNMNIPGNLQVAGTGTSYIMGNVGIGTTSPGDLLHLNGSEPAMILEANSVNTGEFDLAFRKSRSNGVITSGDRLGRIIYYAHNGTTFNPSARIDVWSEGTITQQIPANIRFYTMNTTSSLDERMRITADGNVGIGTTNPSRSLEVWGSGPIFANSSGSPRFALNLQGDGSWVLYDYFGNSWHLGIAQQNGNVGIGTALPSYQLQLSTDSAAKPTTNTWTIASDARIKTDIRPFTDGLSVIEGINPVWYQYNGLGGFKADGKDNIGVVAQDIQKVAPYTVNTYSAKLNPNDTNETELLNFNSHALTFVLINSVKEQQKQIDQLHMENQELKNKLDNLESRIALLEVK